MKLEGRDGHADVVPTAAVVTVEADSFRATAEGCGVEEWLEIQGIFAGVFCIN